MRFAVAGLAHETNTFATAVLGRTAYDAFAITRGEELLARFQGTRTYVGGMIDSAHQVGVELVPAFHAIAEPSGIIAAEAYAALREELVDRLRCTGPVDAVALELHGAAVAEGVDDVETDLVGAVREAVGAGVPIGACLDLHGNLTPELVRAIDFLIGVRYYPHVDMYERGHDVVCALAAVHRGVLVPVSALVALPMLLPTTSTDLEPAAGIARLCAEIEAGPWIRACTFFHGFPGADVPFAGASVLVTADRDAEAAAAAAATVARHVWDRRNDLLVEPVDAHDAVRLALATPGRPIVVAETADNPGGGAPGDATHLVRAFLDAAASGGRFCFASIFDPAAVAAAAGAGVGATVEVSLGGHHDRAHDSPIELPADVRALSDGRFRLTSPMGRGRTVDMGPSALLRIGGVDVVVATEREQIWDAGIFELHGVDVRRYDVVGVKGSVHFRAGFADIAAGVVVADTPSLLARDVCLLDRTTRPRPWWPLDADTPAPAAILDGSTS